MTPRKKRNSGKGEKLEHPKPFVGKLSTNVKGLPREYELSPLTLIIGPNRAGKTSIVDSLSLALTGEAASDTMTKRGVDLMGLVPDGIGELAVRATIENGKPDKESLSFSVSGSTAKASKPVWEGPSSGAAFILKEARELLGKDPKKLREALLKRVGGEITPTQLQERIPHALWELWSGGVQREVWSLDQVLERSEAISKELRVTRRQIEDCEVIEAPTELSDREEEELSRLRVAAAKRGLPESVIQNMRGSKEALENQVAALETEIARIPVQEYDAASVAFLQHANIARESLLGAMRARGLEKGRCPVCRGPVELQGLLKAGEEAAEVLGSLQSALSSIQKSESLQRALDEQRRRLGGLSRELAQATISNPREEQRLQELQGRQIAVENYLNTKKELIRLQQRETNLKALKGLSETLAGELLDARVEELSDRISDALPAGMKANIVLRDGNRQVCRVLLKAGNEPERPFQTLSGAEKALLVSAFATALGGNGEMRVLVVDDVWLDQKTMGSFTRAMGDLIGTEDGPNQVVLCAVKWTGKRPEGWGVIEL